LATRQPLLPADMIGTAEKIHTVHPPPVAVNSMLPTFQAL
jgi:hypothetical protein